MGLDLLHIVHALVPGALGVVDGPAVLPVKDQGHLGVDVALGDGVNALQQLAHGLYVLELPGLGAALVVHHRAVELLKGAAALAELEVLHGVGAVGHGLHAAHPVLAGLFQLGDRPPVGGAGGGFHQQEGLALDGAHGVVPQAVDRGQLGVVAAPPLGIGVPADDVQLVLKLKVVVVVVVVHKVGGAGDGGVHRLYGVPLRLDKVHHLVGDKALPIQVLDKGAVLPLGAGGVNLLPVGDGVGPEVVPPGVVQSFQGAVLLFQPLPEGRLAQGAAALAAVLVGQVPQNDPGVLGEALGQGGVHQAHLLPVDGGGVAVVVPAAALVPVEAGADPADFRVLLAHPQGLGAGRRGQHGVDAVFVQVVNDLFQPAELVAALFGLQLGPGENGHGYAVDMGLLHQADVGL